MGQESGTAGKESRDRREPGLGEGVHRGQGSKVAQGGRNRGLGRGKAGGIGGLGQSSISGTWKQKGGGREQDRGF